MKNGVASRSRHAVAMNQNQPMGKAQGRAEVLVLEDNPGDAGLLHAELSAEVLIEVNLTVAPRLSDGLVLIEVNLTVAPRLSDGLDLLGIREFDAVLVDLNLPDSQGMATFERLRAVVPDR